jgi:chemotaxis regulatin CheY-phosphate phosphatase CheZ
MKRITVKDKRDFIRKAKQICEEIADARDRLRDLLSDYEEIAENADELVTELEYAIDKISGLL